MATQTYKGHAKETKKELPARVAQWYYKHGLFLSSYPTCATSLAIFIVLCSCYPLLHIPLPGTIPTKIVLPYESMPATGTQSPESATAANNLLRMNNSTFEQPFPWASSDPFIYIQQIVMRTSVIPWRKNLLLTDAYRAPLHEIFKLLEIVRNHEDEVTKTSLANICLHVENVKMPSKYSVFPEYNCLILSPANLWQQNAQNFKRDTNLLSTIFHHHNMQKSKVSTSEMLFGMPLSDSGVKRYPIRIRPRIIQYAITLVLTKNDPDFVESLREKLVQAYPLHQDDESSTSHRDSITYIYYPSEFNWLEFLPMCAAFLLVFVYVYFSLRKIDAFKSRVLVALCAVFTVLSSLLMTLGLCFFFGLTISMQSRGVLPYLIMLFGLENVLVITKSVVSTEDKFDVKIRIAQALSKEGWSISKTLLTEITILTIGLITFVPVIQEFCIFAIVGLISDFFMQMLLFSTVLAMNIRRVEFSNLAKQTVVPDMTRRIPYRFVNSTQTSPSASSSGTINRSRSHPKFLAAQDSVQATDVVAAGKPIVDKKKIPKRLKIVNFWARTRFFQRAFMLWMTVWIFSIVYNAGIFEHIFVMETKNRTEFADNVHVDGSAFSSTNGTDSPLKIINRIPFLNKGGEPSPQKTAYFDEEHYNLTEQLNKLRHPDYDTSLHLSNFHWSSILRQYNISMSGKYVTILPTIRLSHAVSADKAIQLRNVDEKPTQHFQWKTLAIALDPIDFADMDEKEGSIAYHLAGSNGINSTPLYPKTPMEILLATILCIISIFVLTYTMIVFYRCICSRNYAEWRSSWNDAKTDVVYPKTQRIFESVPIQMKGHTHRIECLVTDGRMVASSCLEGKIMTWDTSTGEQIGTIDRRNYFNINRRLSGTYTQTGNYDLPITITTAADSKQKKTNGMSSIWCLDYMDNLIVIGCADGKIEFWESSTGILKCIYEGEGKYKHGITHLHLSGDRLVAARLSGRIDFLRLETYNQGRQIDWGFMSAYRRTHIRTGSTGSLSNSQLPNQAMASMASGSQEELRCFLEQQHQGHQQPVTCMEVNGNTVFTGSQDHTLKVFKLDLANLVYTLHGHYGPITSIFIDHSPSGTGGSGSQDGLLCVWDLLTGACVYSIQAHDGAIVSLVCSSSYVISLGADERLYIWERFQGNLLNTINVPYVYTSLLMLTPSLLVTAKPGSLLVWDVRTGEQTREIKLDCANMHLCPKKILFACGSVICDYGNEMRVIRFPLVTDKCD